MEGKLNSGSSGRAQSTDRAHGLRTVALGLEAERHAAPWDVDLAVGLGGGAINGPKRKRQALPGSRHARFRMGPLLLRRRQVTLALCRGPRGNEQEQPCAQVCVPKDP